MDFRVDIGRPEVRIWLPAEAERELTRRGYEACRRWLEEDYLIYLVHPPVSSAAQLT